MPWLMREVKKEIGHMVESREVLMGKYPFNPFNLNYGRAIVTIHLTYNTSSRRFEIYGTLVIHNNEVS